VNTEYLVWFGVLIVVTGAALVWLAIGEVPDFLVDHETAAEPAEDEGPAPHA
jgi:hypothetical protein